MTHSVWDILCEGVKSVFILGMLATPGRSGLRSPGLGGRMSQLLINEYLNELATLKRVSGVQRESVVREAFKDLLKKWGRSQNLVFIPEHEIITTAKVRNYVDGALMHDLRVPFGYWEAKDATTTSTRRSPRSSAAAIPTPTSSSRIRPRPS